MRWLHIRGRLAAAQLQRNRQLILQDPERVLNTIAPAEAQTPVDRSPEQHRRSPQRQRSHNVLPSPDATVDKDLQLRTRHVSNRRSAAWERIGSADRPVQVAAL